MKAGLQSNFNVVDKLKSGLISLRYSNLKLSFNNKCHKFYDVFP